MTGRTAASSGQRLPERHDRRHPGGASGSRWLVGVRLVVRQGSPLRPGHGGSPVGTSTPGTTGRMSLDGMRFEWAIETVACPFGCVSPNDQIGWSPFGAVIVTRMREPAR